MAARLHRERNCPQHQSRNSQLPEETLPGHGQLCIFWLFAGNSRICCDVEDSAG